MRRRWLIAVMTFLVTGLVVSGSEVLGLSSADTGGLAVEDPVVVWTVGDICDDDHAAADCEDVGDLIEADIAKDYFVSLGDNQYEVGALGAFTTYYAPKMGAFKAITKPALGNHEYRTSGAKGYFDYFGAAAGRRDLGYYAFATGDWQVVVLNTACRFVAGGCGYSSTEGRWLDTTLQATQTCELVVGHHPRITDGEYAPGIPSMNAFFRHAYENRAEMYVSGHDHNYQRFAPRRGDLSIDPAAGVLPLVVGTGGTSLYPWGDNPDRSVYRQNTTFGALRLELEPTGYRGAFYGTDGVILDSFSGTCR